jgi:rare lipoprotein A
MLVMAIQLPHLHVARRARFALLTALAVVACGCAGAHPAATSPVTGPPPETGVASYYAHQHDGRRTASGERFDMSAMTAAHRTLAFGTRVRVTNLDNGRSVVVRINDRGPFRKARVIDVSYGAAQELRMITAGTAQVKIDILPAADAADAND